MNTNTFRKSLAALAFVASLPAAAAQDPDFMREMARTDGNPQGDYAIPTLPDYTLAKVDAAKHTAFLAELARTDGNVAPVEHKPSDTTVARR